ncbi:transcriptional regulator GcvA [Piscinibacter sp.]|jgi:DNA-binding transcriptional LysR family regulator|uniref:transcriptional regulator GcvA n=1 Tax=Piscinibacter sp. TaxID=1903157 RepID=UPI002F3ED00C
MDKPRPRLSLDLLKGFEAAARHLSFTLAASELFITQSAVSRQVKTLEEQLALPLFRRVNRGLLLTDAGQTLFGAMHGALALIDDATAKLTGARARPTLNVTAAAPFASLWLVPRLPQFTALHPDCDLRIVASNQALDLEREDTDVVIRLYRTGGAPARAQRLAPDVVLPVCAPRLLRDRTRPLKSPEQLAQHVLLRFENVDRGRPQIDWFRWLETMKLSNLKPAGMMSFSHYDQVVQAALDGNGVALGRLPLVSRHLRDGALVAPFADKLVGKGAWYAVTGAESAQRPAVRAFVDWLRDEMQREAQGADSGENARRAASRARR